MLTETHTNYSYKTQQRTRRLSNVDGALLLLLSWWWLLRLLLGREEPSHLCLPVAPVLAHDRLCGRVHPLLEGAGLEGRGGHAEGLGGGGSHRLAVTACLCVLRGGGLGEDEDRQDRERSEE